MALLIKLHLDHPQPRLISQVVSRLQAGGVIVYPTDSGFALGCMLGQSDAQMRIRQIRGVDDKHLFTLICRNLSELGHYAVVSNSQFRLLKANTPGAYTFILKATREVPRKLQHPKRSTIGIRVPQHSIVQAILASLGAPMLSMTMRVATEDVVLDEVWQMHAYLNNVVDLVIDVDQYSHGETSVIDLTADAPTLIRAGLGDLTPFGLDEIE
jgi:tRNA threonylcarbamoyl adenosine modification protein (Sua5/YciO/YrdC/YwlC family)